MFYILSKVLSFCISPLIWFFIILGIGLLLKNKKKRKILIFLSLIVFYVFSNDFILNSTKKSGKPNQNEILSLLKKFDYGIVLGGIASYNVEYEMVDFYEAADRIMYAVKFYEMNKIDKIFISGGSAKLINNDKKEADYLKSYLLDLNIPEEDIIIENKSKNTYENAVFTAEKLQNSLDTSSFILFTSALHIKRAIACFEKQNIKAESFPVDFKSNEAEFNLEFLLVPKPEVLKEWSLFLHEVIGFYIYKIQGYL